MLAEPLRRVMEAAPPVPSSVMLLVRTAGEMMYKLSSLYTIEPRVTLGRSRVIVRVAVMTPRKRAVSPTALGTPAVQLAAALQLPLALRFQVLSTARAVGLAANTNVAAAAMFA